MASLMAVLQIALASIIDSDVLDSFWQRSMPRFQTNFHQWASMDDLVASSSPRAMLASFQRWPASLAGMPLLDPGVLAMGEGAVGISSREASPSQHCLGCSSGRMCSLDQKDLQIWGGRGMSMTMEFSPFWVDFPDTCPDMSNTAHDRSSLTSIVMLTSLSTFGGGVLTGLGTWMGAE